MNLVEKLKFFHVLFLSKIDGEKVFADALDKKEAFKDYKNNCVRKTQNQNFFVKKRFSTFYIGNKPFGTSKTALSKTHKIGIFAKGLGHRFDQKFEISSTWIFMQNRLRKSIWVPSS